MITFIQLLISFIIGSVSIPRALKNFCLHSSVITFLIFNKLPSGVAFPGWKRHKDSRVDRRITAWEKAMCSFSRTAWHGLERHGGALQSLVKKHRRHSSERERNRIKEDSPFTVKIVPMRLFSFFSPCTIALVCPLFSLQTVNFSCSRVQFPCILYKEKKKRKRMVRLHWGVVDF